MSRHYLCTLPAASWSPAAFLTPSWSFTITPTQSHSHSLAVTAHTRMHTHTVFWPSSCLGGLSQRAGGDIFKVTHSNPVPLTHMRLTTATRLMRGNDTSAFSRNNMQPWQESCQGKELPQIRSTFFSCDMKPLWWICTYVKDTMRSFSIFVNVTLMNLAVKLATTPDNAD